MEQILLNSGIGIESMALLLLLPIIASFIGISRHLIGFRSLGIYLSIVMVLILYQLGSVNGTAYSDLLTGLKYGIFLIPFIFLASAFSYRLVKNLAIHYYPKLSILLLNVVLMMLLMIFVLGLLNVNFIIRLNTFTLVLIAGISEKYISILTRKRISATLIIAGESLIQAIICYTLISYKPFMDLIIRYPYLILLLLPINYFVGRFSGLRLSEYIRFKKILDKIE